MPTPQESLSNYIRSNKVIPVIGAGVSYATADIPGWKGLIENGLQYAIDRLRGTKHDKVNVIRDLIGQNELIDAASELKKLLGGTHGAYKNWLHDFFKDHHAIRSTRLIKSIKCLLAPFLCTTNYDGLLSSIEVFATPSKFDWTEAGRVQNAINEEEEFVFHLHGVHNRIETVIFTREDYEYLKKDKPYNALLENLWNNYHLLFIGCSTDGVLDADFLITIQYLRDLFPESTQVHYLLLSEKNIVDQLDFLSKYNVEIISFGDDHDMLPDFIDSINPNLGSAVEKYRSGAQKAMAQFEIAAKEYFTDPGGWKEPDKLVYLRRSVEDTNLLYLSKRERFVFITDTLRKIIDINVIEQQIELWNEFGFDDVSNLSNETYVKAAVQSFEALKNIPKDILEDIHYHRFGTIHPRWFENGLDSFIFEFRTFEQSKKEDVYYFFRSDRYFFENLKRIMTSFIGVMHLSAEDLYPKVEHAQITKKFPKKALLTVTEKDITIRDIETDQIVASVKAEIAPFRRAKFIDLRGSVIVAGHTDSEAFYWDPLKDDTLNIYHRSKGIVTIYHTEHQYINKEVRSLISTSQGTLRLTNFDLVETIDSSYWSDVIAFGDTLIASTKNESVPEGTYLLRRSGDEDVQPVLILRDIWDNIRSIPDINEKFDRLKLNDGNDEISDRSKFPIISNTFIRKLTVSDKEYVAIRINLSTSMFSTDRLSILLLYDLEGKPLQLEGYFLLESGLSIAFDSFVANGVDQLMVGYLDQGNDIDLVETYEIVRNGQYFTGRLASSFHHADNTTDDIYQIIHASKSHSVINESGKRVILVDRDNNEKIVVEAEQDVYIKNIDAVFLD